MPAEAGPDRAALEAAVEAAYGVTGRLVAMEGGYDSAATVYRLGADHVLKARRGRPYEPGVVVPAALAEQGMPGIPAPIGTVDGRLWTSTGNGELGLTLHPFIEGTTAAAIGLSPDQWRQFGAMVRRLHDAELPVAGLPAERHQPKWGGADRTWDDARAVVPCLGDDHRNTFARLIDDAEKLATELPDSPHVLCHADLHTYNVLVDPADGLWLLDWDEVMLAPRERDLMFVTGGGISRELVSPDAERAFASGYGDVRLDADALRYYRLTWAVQDIADYGTRAAAGDPDAARMLRLVFEPGQIVDLTR